MIDALHVTNIYSLFCIILVLQLVHSTVYCISASTREFGRLFMLHAKEKTAEEFRPQAGLQMFLSDVNTVGIRDLLICRTNLLTYLSTYLLRFSSVYVLSFFVTGFCR